MREPTTEPLILRLMVELGKAGREPARVYFAGGATAVLHGWRRTTIDVDLKIVPDTGELLRAIPRLKEELRVNVELASPGDFIPELPGWEERSPFIRQEGRVSFHHYDPYAQALSKIERGHAQDRRDVQSMIDEGLVERGKLLEFFESIEGELYRFPAIDASTFRQAVLDWTLPASPEGDGGFGGRA